MVFVQMTAFLASLKNSQVNETKCARKGPSPSPLPPAPPSSSCSWVDGAGLSGADAHLAHVKTKEQCCGLCLADKLCKGATFYGGSCHIKHTGPSVQKVHTRGSLLLNF